MDDLKLQLFRAQGKKRDAVEVLQIEDEQLEKVKMEIKDKPQLAMTVSDHALVMFCKRALKHEFSDHIKSILNLCDNAELLEERNKNDGKIEYVYQTEGPNNTMLKFIVVQNNIVTCYVNDMENVKQT